MFIYVLWPVCALHGCASIWGSARARDRALRHAHAALESSGRGNDQIGFRKFGKSVFISYTCIVVSGNERCLLGTRRSRTACILEYAYESVGSEISLTRYMQSTCGLVAHFFPYQYYFALLSGLGWVEGCLLNSHNSNNLMLFPIDCCVAEFKEHGRYCLVCLLRYSLPYIVLVPFNREKEVHSLILAGTIWNSTCHVPLHNFSSWGVGYWNLCT